MCHSSEYTSGFEYASVSQGSEYAKKKKNSEYFLVWLNILVFHRVKNKKKKKKSWICLSMTEYTGVCVNKPKSSWMRMAFVLHLLISPIVLQSFYNLNRWLLIWTSTVG